MANPTTITIGSVDYDVYADVAYVDEYMAAAIHGAAWDAATTATKQKACVSFTRVLDRQPWQGTKTDDAQPLAFPRTGLTDLAGNVVDPDTIPEVFLRAFCEGCLALVDGSELQTAQNTESNVASLSAGSVSISFWRGAGGEPTRFPTIVHELIGYWLASASAGIGSATGTGLDGCSGFDDADAFNFSQGA